MKDDKKNMLAKVAYLYYFEEKTQNEIAEELKIYRTTVSRMIKQAKDEGIVKIEIQEFNTQIYALERHMKSKYKLKDIEIVPVVESDSNEKKNQKLSKAAAAYIKRKIEMDSIVGVSWGETLGDTVAEIESKKKTNAMFVPIAGGPSHINSKYHVNTLVYEMARKFSGQNIFVNATVIQETPQLKKGIMDSKYFKELKDYWERLDIAIVGIGGPLRIRESQWRDLLTKEDYKDLELREAVGDCCCRFFDHEGKMLKGNLYERTIGLDLYHLKKVPLSVGIARSKVKSKSILAMLKKSYINCLITDEETVLEILRLEKDPYLHTYQLKEI